MLTTRAFVCVGHPLKLAIRWCLIVHPTPMALKALILLTLLSRTPHHKDTESWESRESRMELVAAGIEESVHQATCKELAECTPIWGGTEKSLAMLLVTQAVSETHLSHRIHDNDCNLAIGECDSTRVWRRELNAYEFVQRSFSLWQIKPYSDIPEDHWALIEKGREGTQLAAWAATRRLASGLTACGDIQGAIARYTTGSACKWSKAPKRFALYKQLMSANPERLAAARDRHAERLKNL